MNLYISILVLLFSVFSYGQFMIYGKVINNSNESISGAKVYLDGSTFKVITNAEGEFKLDVPIRNYQLIVSKSFFENQIINITAKTKFPLEIKLKDEEVGLDEAIITSMSKDDRAFFLSEFRSLFLGRKLSADQTKIANEDDLKLSYDKENKILKVSAKSPLLIENNFLGYTVEYDLIAFEYDYKSTYVLVLGTSNFSSKKGNKLSIKKWELNRRNSYNGSIEHFIKSLFNNSLQQEGFQLRRLIRKENPEYIKFKEELRRSNNITISGKVPSKIISYLVNQPVPIDSLVVEKNNFKYLKFDGLYSVEYLNGKEDMDYVNRFKKSNFSGNQLSIFSINKPVRIYEDGNYHHPENLIVEEYWSYKKIADLLPLDYIMLQ